MATTDVAWVGKRWAATVPDYLALMKPRIVLLLLVTALAAMGAAGEGWPPLGLIAATLVGVALSAGSANALNCYFDRDIDAVMPRTQKRPLPAGRLTPRQALIFAGATGIASFVLLALAANMLAAAIAMAGLLFYVCVYTLWLKRSTPLNIVIGGAAGSVPPLIGWAAVTGAIDLPAALLFFIVFWWTPPHFWALALFRADDYARADVPMLPVVRGVAATKRQILWYTVILVAVSLMIAFTSIGGLVYTTTAVIAGALFIYFAWLNRRDDTGREAYRLFGFSIIYLWVLFFALALQTLV